MSSIAPVRVVTSVLVCLMLMASPLLMGQADTPFICDDNEPVTRAGVQVCERAIAGSRFKEYRVVAQVCATMTGIAEIMTDATRIGDWFPDIEHSEVLVEEPTMQIFYMKSRAPWPFRSRDMVYRLSGEVTPSGDEVFFTIEGLPGYLEPMDDAVRLQAANGSWRLTTIQQLQRVEIELIMHMELGAVPVYLANRRLLSTLTGAVQGLQGLFPCEELLDSE